MADFPGVDYRSSIVGDGFAELDNTSHIDRNVLRHRPGYTRKAAVEGLTASPFATIMAVQATDGTLRTVNLSTFAVSTSKATTGTTPGTWVRYAGRLYWSNGSAGPFVLDDTTNVARVPGITAPSATIGVGTVGAAGGSIIEGAHLFRYRYKNAATGYLSNPSGAITKTLATDDKVTFSIGTSGTDIIRDAAGWADRIVLEATVASGKAFYACYDVPMTDSSIEFTFNDINISARTPALVYGDDGHNPMPQFDLIIEHRTRIFGLKASAKLLGWSRPGFPEAFDLTLYARGLASMEPGDSVVGLASFMGDLYLFNTYGMSRFTYADDPTNGTILSIPTDQGLWNQRCVVSVNNIMYGFGPGGVWQVRAMNPDKISSEVDPFIEDTLDVDQTTDIFGWYNQDDRSITWAFTAIGDTEPKRAITYAIATGKWSTRTYKHSLLGAVYGYQKNYLFANGYMWQERSGYYDGVPTVTTATATTTATGTIVTTETMDDYIGGHLTFGDETRMITGYTANSLTVDTPFTAIAIGDVGFIGAAPASLETEWIADPDLATLKNPASILVEFEPAQSARSMSLQVFLDFSTSPEVWTRDISDTPPSGISYNNGDTAITIAADGGSGLGFVPVPMPSTFSRCFKLRLEVNDPIDPFGILGLHHAAREDVQAVPGTGE